MADPGEGVTADGTIRTGARRDRVPAVFEPVLADAAAVAGESGASLYVYGSVANGTARPGSSDVVLLSVGLPDAAAAGQRLSARYAGICPGVDSASQPSMENAHVARLLLRTARISRSADMGTDPAPCFAGVPYASMHPAAIATTASSPPTRLSTRAWERVMIGQLPLIMGFQLAGEAVVALTGLNFPGSAVRFCCSCWRGWPYEAVRRRNCLGLPAP